ncbi:MULTISPECIES: nucleotide exchange factor GrpE [Alistipes]|uniref:nucleotide exchange factor GrpE n=1 Tax=Alistipes TaxID=239759 RepID=UPI001B36BCCC|nr:MULTISPECIES: nucleotide exchange factor GrpE [Alistipes]MBQ4903305.1 nucleotide exchange factor GrpE [Alistipes sp. Marseille-P2263]MCI2259060.1 nucleotide exchange factor GrpE [Alistipes dispar]
MKKKEVYNEAVNGDEGFSAGDGYPSCDGEPCANVADDAEDATATMAVGGETSEPEAAVELEAVVAEWQDKYLRLQAEFDNYRKRTLREKMDLVQTGGRDVLLAMLPVRDDVQRALAAMEKSDDVEALRSGVLLISQKFTEALRQKGVTEIEVKDKDFDAEYCEAVARFAAGEEKKGKVIDVVQTGYMLGERVLRFAKVVVGE